jgi:lysozyme family protein
MPTPRFDNFIDWILEWETEYNKDGTARTEHDPDDPGGTTKYGIDQRSHPNIDIASLTLDQAKQIYFVEWTRCDAENMPAKLGEAYFNAVVNTGKGRADKLLVLAHGSAQNFILAQGKFYRSLAESRPSSRKYLKGWINRLNSLWDELALPSFSP